MPSASVDQLLPLLSPAGSAVLGAAREEARFRGCSFVGVEHLFVALVKAPSGRLAMALETLGANPKPVRDAVRRFAGGGGDEVYAAPTRVTPRLSAVALEAKRIGGAVADEPDLVAALLGDADAAPTIVLSQASVDLRRLSELTRSLENVSADPRRSSPSREDSILSRYGRDLTALARAGRLPEVVGRDAEIRSLLRALCRQTKNAPLLVGEPGVGKTAVVEALAAAIAKGNVPKELAGKRIVEITMSSLVAGTKFRGELEERLEKLVAEAREDPDVILFVDEVHQLVASGQGDLDAAEVMKPALARAEIRVIGATTTAEYAKTIEKDGALARRFQVVRIEEPSEADSLVIARARRGPLEKHHGVVIDDAAIEAAVTLSIRYLPEAHLPDKAIDLLDEACARLRVRSISEAEADRVTADVVAAAVADRKGIPVARLTEADEDRLLRLEEELRKRIVGQDAACRAVAARIRLARAGLRDPGKPVAVLLFLGPTGVGKTELAKALAELLLGSERELVRVDMGEYSERFSLTRLIGSPPGYIGSEEEGQLTRELRKKPASVVLLDEIEKAHPDLWDLFLQAFDEGRMTDAQGRIVDCRSAIFVMTSNLGSELWNRSRSRVGFASKETADESVPPVEEVTGVLRKTFRPELLNRVDENVLFRKLSAGDLTDIARIHVSRLVSRLAGRGLDLTVTDAALAEVARLGYDPERGARPIERAVEERIGRPVSEAILARKLVSGGALVVDFVGGALTFGPKAAE